jgi:DeoR/GlpR family transcriptional regulator of sugar metabolism
MSGMNTDSRQDVEAAEATLPDYAIPAQRRGELLKVAKERGAINVAESATQFAVSADTIRRDLDYLAERGLLKRTHGGAVPLDDVIVPDIPVAQRLVSRAAEKGRIARRAATLIADGETLLIYGGSTTRAFVSELGSRRSLTIVTNDLGIPAAMPPEAARSVYLLGGQVNVQSQITIGTVGFPQAGPISADTAVLGVGGISERGLSTTIFEEASMMAAMVSAARRLIVLADASKLDRSVFAHVVPLDQIDILVTDAKPSAQLAAVLSESGVEIVVAA